MLRYRGQLIMTPREKLTQVLDKADKHPYDMIHKDCKDPQARADELGKQMAKVEANQDKARDDMAELRRRYERDCRLHKVKPVPQGKASDVRNKTGPAL